MAVIAKNFDPRLLGGKFTTPEQLLANPGALRARQEAVAIGFQGGSGPGGWGGGNYRRYIEQRQTLPQPIRPGPGLPIRPDRPYMPPSIPGPRPVKPPSRIDDWPVKDSWPNAPRPPEGGWPPFPRPPEGGPFRPLMSPSYAPPVDGSFDPNLLGGNYTTQAALEANPTALANRQAGLEAGFVGGSSDQGWGDQRYAQFQAGQDYANETRTQQWIPTASNDPRLLGGNYTTQAELADNPEAMLNRQKAISRGFTGGEDWGQGRYNQWLQGTRNPESQKGKYYGSPPRELNQGKYYGSPPRELNQYVGAETGTAGLMAPMPEMAPKQGGFTNLGQGQQYLEGLRQLKRGQ